MTYPAAGEFELIVDSAGEPYLSCPACTDWVDLRNGTTIRDLIGAASEHARLAHPVSHPAAMIAP